MIVAVGRLAESVRLCVCGSICPNWCGLLAYSVGADSSFSYVLIIDAVVHKSVSSTRKTAYCIVDVRRILQIIN